MTLKPFDLALVPIEQAVIDKKILDENIIELYMKLSSDDTAILVGSRGHWIQF